MIRLLPTESGLVRDESNLAKMGPYQTESRRANRVRRVHAQASERKLLLDELRHK